MQLYIKRMLNVYVNSEVQDYSGHLHALDQELHDPQADSMTFKDSKSKLRLKARR